jgi:hypothetical protein
LLAYYAAPAEAERARKGHPETANLTMPFRKLAEAVGGGRLQKQDTGRRSGNSSGSVLSRAAAPAVKAPLWNSRDAATEL